VEITSTAYRTDLALLELGGSVVDDRGDRLVVRTPSNPSFHWGNFLLLDRVPAAKDVPFLLGELDAMFPASHHRALGVDGTLPPPADALRPLQDAGLRPRRVVRADRPRDASAAATRHAGGVPAVDER
jgi:hypothetical protein